MSKIEYQFEDPVTGMISEPMTAEEIARLLGCNTSSVKEAQRQGYKLLRRYKVYRMPGEDFATAWNRARMRVLERAER